MARSLLVAPVADHSALARTCLGLLRALDRQGVKVAFVKPVAQPSADGGPDRSAELVAAVTTLRPPEPLSTALLEQQLGQGELEVVLEKIVAAWEPVYGGSDVVVIQGLSRVDTATVWRMLSVKPGDLFRQDRLYLSQRDLYDIGVFRSANVLLADSLPPTAPGDTLVRVVVRVVEGAGHRILGGMGFGTIDCFRVQGGWTAYDFFGGARAERTTNSTVFAQTRIPFTSTNDNTRYEGKLTGTIARGQTLQGLFIDNRTDLKIQIFIDDGYRVRGAPVRVQDVHASGCRGEPRRHHQRAPQHPRDDRVWLLRGSHDGRRCGAVQCVPGVRCERPGAAHEGSPVRRRDGLRGA